jgi:hypothetical protein
MGKGGAYTACPLLAGHGYGKGLEASVMGLHGPINENPPNGGLTRRGNGITLKLTFSVMEMYTAVLAVSNTPTRSPLTWVKSVSEGPVV